MEGEPEQDALDVVTIMMKEPRWEWWDSMEGDRKQRAVNFFQILQASQGNHMNKHMCSRMLDSLVMMSESRIIAGSDNDGEPDGHRP